MNEKQQKANETYRTGRTEPPKSRQGLVCILLALVIFLCGVSTALGLMNIHLFRRLDSLAGQTDPALAFNPAEDTGAEDTVLFHALGLSGETVSDFWQQYQELPQGIYITEVTDRAAQSGLLAGDILLRFGGQLTENVQALQALLTQCTDGEIAELVIFRDGVQKTVHITLDIQP